MSRIGVIVFVKNPELGKVKTRLAASVGDEEALAIYIRLLDHTCDVMSGLPTVQRYVFYSQKVMHNDRWPEDTFIKSQQVDGDLGHKLKAAFAEVFTQCDKVIVIGSDCAQLSSSHIQDAINQLDRCNVVIGPSLDGGYYLLGMDKNYSFLFDNITWSTATVYVETIDNALHNGLTYTSIEQLSDIDYIEDWEQYGLGDQ